MAAIAIVLFAPSLEAAADDNVPITDGQGVSATVDSTTVTPRQRQHRAEKPVVFIDSKATAQQAVDQARLREAEFRRKVASFERDLAKHQECVASTHGGDGNCTSAILSLTDPGYLLQTQIADGDEETPQITLTPTEVAYIAFARLNLTPPALGIGPSPERNKWKMAAVGYPLWLWGEGVTDPAPVSDAVFNLYVSLDARVASIDFDMGDGHTVTCEGTGSEWTTTVKAGQPSPTCGYTYQKPSLPKSKYTVTVRTHWAVDWNINGATGTIPFIQASSTTIPVGELQVLVR